MTRAFPIIRAYQDSVCPTPSQKAVTTTLSAEAKVDATLPGMLAKLLKLGGEVSAKAQRVQSDGVERAQLAKLLMSNYDCRYNVTRYLFDKFAGPAPAIVPETRIVAGAPIARAATAAAVPPRHSPRTTPAPPPPGPVDPNAPDGILRIFLKQNMTRQDLVALAGLLPTFDVRQVRSLVDVANPDDALFVNRNRVSRAEVEKVLTALDRLGVHIKTVQQFDKNSSLEGRKEIQVGTMVGRFKDLSPLALADLSRLDDTAFWKAALNGRAFCNDTAHKSHPCLIGKDGRPTPS